MFYLLLFLVYFTLKILLLKILNCLLFLIKKIALTILTTPLCWFGIGTNLAFLPHRTPQLILSSHFQYRFPSKIHNFPPKTYPPNHNLFTLPFASPANDLTVHPLSIFLNHHTQPD